MVEVIGFVRMEHVVEFLPVRNFHLVPLSFEIDSILTGVGIVLDRVLTGYPTFHT